MTQLIGDTTIEARQSLVTGALLGTDRRPGRRADEPGAGPAGQPMADPVTALLDRAVAYRTAVQAGSPLARCAAPAVAPGERLLAAPLPAQDLLARVLERPEPALVNSWLTTCVEHGRGVSPQHWSRLADLAARSSRYDRPLLRQAIGPRGCWLLSQNPRWKHLSAEDPGVVKPDPAGDSLTVLDGPESALQLFPPQLGTTGPVGPGQWEHALDLVLSGGAGAHTQEVAQLVALGVPLEVGRRWLDRLGSLELAGEMRGSGAGQPASRLVVERSVLLVRRTIATRVEIVDAFAKTAVPESGGTEDGAAQPEPAEPHKTGEMAR